MGVKRMNIKEFRELGFLQEANRQFFHPLGLALEVIVDIENGSEELGGVWDYREDPEGIIFDKSLVLEKAEEMSAKARNVAAERDRHIGRRRKMFGSEIQPIGAWPEPD